MLQQATLPSEHTVRVRTTAFTSPIYVGNGDLFVRVSTSALVSLASGRGAYTTGEVYPIRQGWGKGTRNGDDQGDQGEGEEAGKQEDFESSSRSKRGWTPAGTNSGGSGRAKGGKPFGSPQPAPNGQAQPRYTPREEDHSPKLPSAVSMVLAPPRRARSNALPGGGGNAGERQSVRCHRALSSYKY